MANDSQQSLTQLMLKNNDSSINSQKTTSGNTLD